MALHRAVDPAPESANEALSELGLDCEDLLQPIRAGIAGRRATTANHPRSYPGYRDYAERTASLRETLFAKRFFAAEEHSLCLTVHPQRAFAIMTALGNSATGTDRVDVTTRRRRGVVTVKIVHDNAGLQMEFPLGLIPEAAPHPTTIPTWVLLVFVDEDEVHSELSLARSIGEDGFIDSWIRRIPLPIITLDDTLTSGDEDDRGPEGPDFDVTEH
jgi:hypothetical protein